MSWNWKPGSIILNLSLFLLFFDKLNQNHTHTHSSILQLCNKAMPSQPHCPAQPIRWVSYSRWFVMVGQGYVYRFPRLSFKQPSSACYECPIGTRHALGIRELPVVRWERKGGCKCAPLYQKHSNFRKHLPRDGLCFRARRRLHALTWFTWTLMAEDAAGVF